MKKLLLFIALSFCCLVSEAQVLDTPRYTVYFDKNGLQHMSSTATKLSTITGLFGDLLSKPTTLAGYGITDAQGPITANAPLSLASGVLSIPTASSIITGVLSSTDWSTFNNKQAALTPGTGISIVSNVITNTAPDQTVTLTAGNGISITGTYPNFTISQVAPTITQPTRTLNSNYTVSTTKAAIVYYSLSISVTNPLLSGNSTASAFLEYSTDGGTTWKAATQVGNLSSVALTVTVQITNTQTGIVGGIVPANALNRIRTTTSGTATVTYVSGLEIVY